MIHPWLQSRNRYLNHQTHLQLWFNINVPVLEWRCWFDWAHHICYILWIQICPVVLHLLSLSVSLSLSLCGLFLASAVATLVIFLKIITVFSNPFPLRQLARGFALFSLPFSFLSLSFSSTLLSTTISGCKIIDRQPAIICQPNSADTPRRVLKPHPVLARFGSTLSDAACLCRQKLSGALLVKEKCT